MSHRPASRRPRVALAALALVAAVASPLVAPVPAGAALAPLVTDEGLGIRVDETAFVPGALDSVATQVRPALTGILEQGAGDHAAFAFGSVTASYDLDLSASFVGPGSGGADGAMVVDVEISDLEFEYLVLLPWPFTSCNIWIRPEPIAVSAEASVSRGLLPDSPFAPGSASSDWSTTTYDVSASTYCWSRLPLEPMDWAAFADLGDPASPASLVGPLAAAAAVDSAVLAWEGNVEPVMASLTALAGFEVTVDQVRTDDHGLIVTADVDGTDGVTIGGVFGPYPVGTAVDAGVTSNINSLLAQRDLGGVPSDVIVSLHPNVTNQFLAALTVRLNGNLGTTTISDAIEAVLVDPTLGSCYDPGDWTTRLAAQAPPHLAPTGAGGAPEMQLSEMTLQFRNAGCDPVDPRVATFTGSVDEIAVTSSGSPLGPRGSATDAQWEATRTQADAATAALVPPATDADLRSWARGALATFLAVLVPSHVEMTPDGFPGHLADHCSSCGRYPGDQRVTETFHIL